MRRIALLILATVGLVAPSFGQGTIQFLNSPLTRHQIMQRDYSFIDLPIDLPVVYGIFIGPSANSLSDIPTGPLAKPSATTPGVMGGVPALYHLEGTEHDQIVFARVRLWDAQFGSDWRTASSQGRYYAETDVRQLEPLGPTMGPGTVIWQSRAGASPNRFYPLSIYFIPEPQAIVLLALGGLVLGFSRWRSSRRG